MGTSKINSILKHKRTIIFSLVFLGFIVMIFLMYLLTYINNRPVIFGSKNNKVSKNGSKYFDFSLLCNQISYKNGSSSGKISVAGCISNLTDDIKDVDVQFEIHTNWTTTTDYTSSSTYCFNNDKTLKASTTEQYLSETASLQLNCDYPVKVLPLVKVKKPVIYAKVTYTRLKPTTLSENDRTETIYYKFTYDQYCSSSTIIK